MGVQNCKSAVSENAGQLGLESSRPEPSRPGSTRPGYILYCLLFSPYFHKGYQYEVCFIYKNVQQKFEGIMFGSIYIAGLSILFHSTGLAS